MNTLISIAIAATLSLTAIGAAQAADNDGKPRSQHVRFDDLNLNNERGAKMLYGRIRTAAKDVCAHVGIQSLDDPRRRECIDQAIANAVAKVNHPVLTAYVENNTSIKPKEVERIADKR